MYLLEYPLGNGVRAFSTLRNSGGSGKGTYAAFNITPYCGDHPTNVAQCRKALSAELGIAEERLLLPHQTHGTRVLTIDNDFFRRPTEARITAMEACDALVTRERGVCIGVSTADCVPLLLHDPTQGVAAAVHAGWRGMLARIPQHALSAMAELGSDPRDVRAVIGPSISVDSFEVGEEVVDAFLAEGFPPAIVRPTAPRPHLDLWAACAFLLENQGVALHNIRIAGIDTYTTDDTFFSARRLGIASGRIFTGILMQ